jgi:2-haloacid dehalogenase
MLTTAVKDRYALVCLLSPVAIHFTNECGQIGVLQNIATGKRTTTVADIQKLKDTIKVCMFDQYGSVVDMQGGLTKIATPYLEAKGWKGKPNSFVTWWRRTHFENSMVDALLHKEHTPYREIGFRAVDQVLNRCGIAHTDDEVRNLVSEIEKLECFPEVPAALAKLQTKYKLVVLSNGDPDMLETAKKYHKVPFDRVISVAEANSFKPHVATYTKAAELCGLEMDQVLFVANHAFDVIGVGIELPDQIAHGSLGSAVLGGEGIEPVNQTLGMNPA